jgi:hypothetical protein
VEEHCVVATGGKHLRRRHRRGSLVHLHTTSPPCHRHPGASRRAGALEHHRAVSSPPRTITPAMEPQAPACLPAPHTVATTLPRHGDPTTPEPIGEQHSTELAACFTLRACLCCQPSC